MRVIGKGGMGTVYQAEHVRLDTILAVKEVRAPQTAETDAQSLLQQCEHEARFLVRLHHPNLPQVTDAFLEDDRFFVVMEYIEGVTLEAKQRQAGAEGLPVRTIVEWALQIADVLAYLHSQEPAVIFRDLKPANVMVQGDGRIRLIDFGIARRFQPGAVKDTNLLGSVGYSPPEQFGRHQTDTRTDIFAFGATLHNLLTGRDPSHAPFKFAPARTLNPAVPDALSRLIDCCLRLDADARPQSVHEVAMELLAIRDTLPEAEVSSSAIALADEGTAQPSNPPSGANIILTNATHRNTKKTQRGSQRVGSAALGSDKLPSERLAGTPSGSTVSGVGASPSGEIPLEEQRRRHGLWIGGAAAIIAICGLTAWMMHSGAQRPRPTPGSVSSGQSVPQVSGPPATTGAPTSTGSTTSTASPTPAPADSGSAPITSTARMVTFDAVTVKGISQDPQGHTTMRIAVVGTAEGQPGDQETIAAFFYDSQNNQIVSQTTQAAYSSKDGKLSVAATISLTSSRMPFDIALDIPIAAFPTNITGGIQFHCVAFYGEQRIGETKTYTPVAPALLTPADGSQTIPNTPPTGTSSGAPTSGPTSTAGTLHSSPVRPE